VPDVREPVVHGEPVVSEQHALVPLAAVPGAALAVPAPELERAYDYADEATAASTRRAYASDARRFAAWCATRSLSPCPATPETVAAFLAHEADAGVKPGTLTRRVAAIRFAHVVAGVEPPTSSEAVRRTMKGIRRKKGTKPARKAPATAERLLAMVSHIPIDTLGGLRDRALLLLGFAGAFRRSELAALEVHHLDISHKGLRVTVERSKTDQEQEGAVVAVARGAVACPVAAVSAWLAVAQITAGPVFRTITKAKGGGRRVLDRALTPYTIGEIVKQYAGRAGFDPAAFGGHSLRAGFLTSAAARGKALDRMMAVSRHKKVDTVMTYIRRAKDFEDHAGSGLL
jgi:site-specific recombinase XerD